MEGTTARVGRTGLQAVLALLLSMVLAAGLMPATAYAEGEGEGESTGTVTLAEFKVAVEEWQSYHDQIVVSSDGEGLDIGTLYATESVKNGIAEVLAQANAAIKEAEAEGTDDMTNTYDTLSAAIRDFRNYVNTKEATEQEAKEAIESLEAVMSIVASETGSELEIGTQFVTPTVKESMEYYLEGAQSALNEGDCTTAYSDASEGFAIYTHNVQIRMPSWDELNNYVNAAVYYFNNIYPEADEDKASAGDVIVPDASYDALEAAIDAALEVLQSSSATADQRLEAWLGIEDAMDAISQNYKTKSSSAIVASGENTNTNNASNNSSSSSTPKTGDNTMALAGLLALAGVAAATSGTIAVRRMKNNRE